MPIYVVKDSSNGEAKQHLVSAANVKAAIAAIRDPRYSAWVASDAELIALTKQGIDVVESKPETK